MKILKNLLRWLLFNIWEIFLWLLIAIFGCIATCIGLHYGSWIPPIICATLLLLLVYRKGVAKIIKRISRIDIAGKVVITLDESISTVDSLLSDVKELEQYARRKHDDTLLAVSASMRLKIYLAKEKLVMEKENIEKEVSGNNANGEWKRYDNGEQECIQRFPHGLKKPDGNNLSYLFVYPAAFCETPPIIYFIGINQPRILSKNSSSFMIEMKDDIINGFEIYIKGKWK